MRPYESGKGKAKEDLWVRQTICSQMGVFRCMWNSKSLLFQTVWKALLQQSNF